MKKNERASFDVFILNKCSSGNCAFTKQGYWVQDKCTNFSMNPKAYHLMAQHQAILKYIFLVKMQSIYENKMGENCDCVYVKNLQLQC